MQGVKERRLYKSSYYYMIITNPRLGSVMSQIMALVGKRLAAALNKHYRCHYELFYVRWKRVYLDTVDSEENGVAFGGHFLDPHETQLEKMVRQAWVMRRP